MKSGIGFRALARCGASSGDGEGEEEGEEQLEKADGGVKTEDGTFE